MLISDNFLKKCDPASAQLLRRAAWLTNNQRGDYDQISLAWCKAIDYSWTHQDWVAYVPAICFGIWAISKQGDKHLKRVLRYSNDLMQFGREHAAELMAGNHGFSVWLANSYVGTYGSLYHFFQSYYQVSEEKIEELFTHYRQELHTHVGYAPQYTYSYDQMCWALERRDKAQAAKYLATVLQLEKTATSCYVCTNRKVVGALMLTGQLDMAKKRVAEIISDEGIPEAWYDGFRNCASAKASIQYNAMVFHARWMRDPMLLKELFRDHADSLLPSTEDEMDWDPDLLVLAYRGEGNHQRDYYLQEEIAKNLDDSGNLTPRDQLLFYLHCWVYLEMLRRQGVTEVSLSLQKPLWPSAGDSYPLPELTDYLLQRADALGAKFDRARPSFDYPSLRRTIQALLEP